MRPFKRLVNYFGLFILSSAVFTACGGGSGSGGSSDTIPPGEVTLQATAAGGNSISISWTEPADTDYNHVLITWEPGGSTAINIAKGTTAYEITGLTNGTDYTIRVRTADASGNISAGASIEITPPAASVPVHYIYTAADLDAVKDNTDNLDDYYILMANIDLTSYNWTPIGTDIIGDNSDNFTGTFDGNGHIISNLTITRNEDNQGLFGYISGSLIIKLGLADVNITSTHSNIGGLIGIILSGTVRDCFASGNITGDDYTGGLVGQNIEARIEDSYTSGTVSGNLYTGGLVGRNSEDIISGTITGSHSSATVTGIGNFKGGLVGQNDGIIENSYSEGTVYGGGNTGGLIGYNMSGSIDNCYATGDVSITADSYNIDGVGGLVGRTNSGSIMNSYAAVDITVSGSDIYNVTYVGGLIGLNSGTAFYSISQCYAAGNITATISGTGNASQIGGLIGRNEGYTISNCYAIGNVAANETDDDYVGGFIGINAVGSVINCYSVGIAECAGSGDDAGFIVNNISGGTITNCFFNNSNTVNGNGTGKTLAELQNVDTYTETDTTGLDSPWDFINDPNDDLGTDDIWSISAGINGGYPYLTGMEP